MTGFSKVLCAIDLSEQGDEALRQGAALATAFQAQLMVFHALPAAASASPLFPQAGLSERTDFVALERRVLEALHQRVAQWVPKSLSVQVELGSGSAHSAIVTHAEKCGADVIVVGGDGPPTMARALLGAVAERVVRYAHTPVWVARKGARNGPVLIGTDFSAAADAAIALGIELAKRLGAPAHLAHALSIARLVPTDTAPADNAFPTWTEQELSSLRRAAHTKLIAAFDSAHTTGTVTVDDASPGQALPKLAQQMGARLICMGTAGRTGVARVLLGSVAEEVVRKAECPVLVTRAAGHS